MSAYTHSGVVYFAVAGKYIKVGYCAGDLRTRLKQLVGGRGVITPDDYDIAAPIQLVGTIPGCVIRDERRLHGLLAAHHVAGEWFRYDSAFLDHMLSMRYVTYRETLLHFRHARAELKRRPSLAVAA